jgi:putative FmdB family regulatory protein
MPIFEYQCKDCMTVSEFLIGAGNKESIACKKCGTLAMERILSTPFFLDSAKHPPSPRAKPILGCLPVWRIPHYPQPVAN